jgi:hypothetical protein
LHRSFTREAWAEVLASEATKVATAPIAFTPFRFLY